MYSHTHAARLSLFLTQPPHQPPISPPSFLVLPSFSDLLWRYSLRFCLTFALSACFLSRFLSPRRLSTRSATVSPSRLNTPTCHVVVWVHVDVAAHSGAHGESTANGTGSADAKYLRSWGYTDDSAAYTPQRSALVPRVLARDRSPRRAAPGVSDRPIHRNDRSRALSSASSFGVDLATVPGLPSARAATTPLRVKHGNSRIIARSTRAGWKQDRGKIRRRSSEMFAGGRGANAVPVWANTKCFLWRLSRRLFDLLVSYFYFFENQKRTGDILSGEWYRDERRWTFARKMTRGTLREVRFTVAALCAREEFINFETACVRAHAHLWILRSAIFLHEYSNIWIFGTYERYDAECVRLFRRIGYSMLKMVSWIVCSYSYSTLRELKASSCGEDRCGRYDWNDLLSFVFLIRYRNRWWELHTVGKKNRNGDIELFLWS